MLSRTTGIYIGAYLEEPNVWATLAAHDSIIYQENDFEVFIDPDGDTHDYYELEINALNTVTRTCFSSIPTGTAGRPTSIPGRSPACRPASWSTERVEQSGGQDRAGSSDRPSWAVLKEAAQPAAKPGDQWRINFSRVEYRTTTTGGTIVKAVDPATGNHPEDNWVWSPMGLVNIHYPELWGFVQFSEKTAGKGKEAFVARPEEKAKWALRRIYYREWACPPRKACSRRT